MKIFLYSQLPLPEPRGGLEDDLVDFLAEDGEVTGGGGGSPGWNIDVQLSERADTDKVLEGLIVFLRGWPVPKDTYLKIYHDDSEAELERRLVYPLACEGG